MKIILIFTVLLIFSFSPTLLVFGDSHEFMEEQTLPINDFKDDSKYIQEHVNFTILTREMHVVYNLANDDPDKAIEIFNHSQYPDNVFGIANENGDRDPNFLMLKKEIVKINHEQEKIQNAISTLQQDISNLKENNYNPNDDFYYEIATVALIISIIGIGIGIFALIKRK